MRGLSLSARRFLFSPIACIGLFRLSTTILRASVSPSTTLGPFLATICIDIYEVEFFCSMGFKAWPLLSGSEHAIVAGFLCCKMAPKDFPSLSIVFLSLPLLRIGGTPLRGSHKRTMILFLHTHHSLQYPMITLPEVT